MSIRDSGSFGDREETSADAMDGGGDGDVVAVMRGEREARIDDCGEFSVEIVLVVSW